MFALHQSIRLKVVFVREILRLMAEIAFESSHQSSKFSRRIAFILHVQREMREREEVQECHWERWSVCRRNDGVCVCVCRESESSSRCCARWSLFECSPGKTLSMFATPLYMLATRAQRASSIEDWMNNLPSSFVASFFASPLWCYMWHSR